MMRGTPRVPEPVRPPAAKRVVGARLLAREAVLKLHGRSKELWPRRCPTERICRDDHRDDVSGRVQTVGMDQVWKLMAQDESWVERHRPVLDLVLASTLATGEWPAVKTLQRTLDREGLEIDVEACLNDIPLAEGDARGLNQTHFAVRLRQLYWLPKAADLVTVCWRVVRRSIDVYVSDAEALEVSSVDEELLGSLSDGQHGLVTIAALILSGDYLTPLAGGSRGGGKWTYAIDESVARGMRRCVSIEDYFVAQDVIREARQARVVIVPDVATTFETTPMLTEPPVAGHAFISYVREDKDQVDALQRILVAAGIRVWRDKDSLFPGQDWKVEIRRAITGGSFAFLACFSENSAARGVSYQNEELVLAVEQYRLRPPGRTWLLPIRFGDVVLPAFDLGAGRTLDSVHRADLFGEAADESKARLLAAVLKVVNPADATHERAVPSVTIETKSDVSEVQRLKLILNQPEQQIAVEDTVMEVVARTRQRLLDGSDFPLNSHKLEDVAEANAYLVGQAEKYRLVMKPLCDLLATGCAYGSTGQDQLWARAVRAIGNTRRGEAGQTVLIDLQSLPLVLTVYAASLGALQRRNWHALRAVCVDALVNSTGDPSGGLPAVTLANPYRPFAHAELSINILALAADQGMSVELVEKLAGGQIGRRHTPGSDYLHAHLKGSLASLVMDEQEYDDLFDELEVIFTLLVVHEQTSRDGQAVVPSHWFGRFLWRNPYANPALPDRMSMQLATMAGAWPPLAAGLFEGKAEAAEDAFSRVLPRIQNARNGLH